MNDEEYRKNLCLTLLVFLTRLADKGKRRPLEQIGLDSRQIRRLRQLRVETIQQLPDMIHQAFDFTIDAQALDAAISLTEFPSSDQQTIVKLIQCGSPLWLVRQIYGLQNSDYTALRRYLGIRRSGRPAALTESEENLVRQAWDDHGHLELPRRLIAVYEATGISLCSVLKAVCLEEAEEDQDHG